MTLSELAALASAEKMIPNAPVKAHCSVEINASVEKIWQTLTTVSRWEHWYPYLKNARLDGPFETGAGLTYGGMFKHDLHIAKIKERKLAMIYGTLMGYTAITRWDVEKLADTRAKVSFSESSDGFLIGTLYSNKSLGKHLQNWLDKLKMEGERS